MTTYLFYDLETTGLNKAFDQILQFAAIRTDEDFNELERHELRVRLRPDVIPAPQAVLTHELSIDDMQQGMKEIEAVLIIHQLFNTPNTISIGYNTLGFDDEFLRFCFYRNLLAPYTHQFANHCRRMDIYPILIFYYLFNSSIIRWPIQQEKVRLKLDAINETNQFVQGNAHHAMVDVEITLALAKKLRSDKKMWEYLVGYFSKENCYQRLQKLSPAFQQHSQKYWQGLMIEGNLGHDSYYQCPALHLGTSYSYKNQRLWLRLDKPEITQTTINNIAESTWVLRKKPGEDELFLPFTDTYTKHLSYERQQLMQKNILWLSEHPDILAAITDYHCHYAHPEIPNLDLDAALYAHGFWSDATVNLCRRFHSLSGTEKSKIIDQFMNQSLQEQAIRLLARNYPESLSEKQLAVYEKYLSGINPDNAEATPVDYTGKKRYTAKAAMNDIEELKKNAQLTEKQKQLLDGLAAYLFNRFCQPLY